MGTTSHSYTNEHEACRLRMPRLFNALLETTIGRAALRCGATSPIAEVVVRAAMKPELRLGQ
jgi:hypothetical protein